MVKKDTLAGWHFALALDNFGIGGGDMNDADEDDPLWVDECFCQYASLFCKLIIIVDRVAAPHAVANFLIKYVFKLKSSWCL